MWRVLIGYKQILYHFIEKIGRTEGLGTHREF